MVPVVASIAPDHGAAVVGLVAPGTDPDLVPALVSDLEGERYRRRTCEQPFNEETIVRTKNWSWFDNTLL